MSSRLASYAEIDERIVRTLAPDPRDTSIPVATAYALRHALGLDDRDIRPALRRLQRAGRIRYDRAIQRWTAPMQ